MKRFFYLLTLMSTTLTSQAAEWIVVALQPQAEATFLEISLPDGVTASSPSHGGLVDSRSKALKWGPLETAVSAVSFTGATSLPEANLTVASWPNAAVANTSIKTAKDADGDGLSEQVENQLGTSDLDPTDANKDSDQDGRSNLAETLSGSDPQSASSLTTAGEAVYNAPTGTLHIRIPQELKLEGIVIETATSLAAPVWERVSQWSLVTPIDGPATIQIKDSTQSASPTRFYRFRWGS